MKNFKQTIYAALNDHTSRVFVRVQIFISIFTIVSILGIILETVQSLQKYGSWFLVIEWLPASVFLLEYLVRLLTANKKLQ